MDAKLVEGARKKKCFERNERALSETPFSLSENEGALSETPFSLSENEKSHKKSHRMNRLKVAEIHMMA
jgi:hypothetical protein